MSVSTRSKSLALALLLSLISSLLLSATPASADEKEDKDRVKCRSTKVLAQVNKKVSPPTTLLKRAPRLITISTNCGTIAIRTYFREAPLTVTALTTLINSGYYTRTQCHRLSTKGINWVQCGDPTATGLGDPGFSYKDENLPEVEENNYPRGTVAMSNFGRPDTNGSQFLLFYEDTTLRSPNYTIWGEIISGIEIIEHIAAGGVKGGNSEGVPVRTLVIERITLR
jgi:peptidyl-prolyl cis-trans isomerase B (cyclophilin B)